MKLRFILVDTSDKAEHKTENISAKNLSEAIIVLERKYEDCLVRDVRELSS